MDVIGLSHGYDRYGAGTIYSFVGALLTVGLDEYGSAIESIHFVACLKSRTTKPRSTLEGLFEQFHNYLKTLPKGTFYRRLKRVEISFQSEHFVSEDDKVGRPSANKCNTGAEEIAAVLPLVKKRIKSTDDFDVDRFLADAARLLTTRIDSVEEWEHLRQQAKEKQAASRATKSPWELLEIDWSQYHRKAWEILDDPFFWKCADDVAPHGNDTGADLLDDYRRWDKCNRSRSPLDFLDRLLEGWDIKPIDWSMTDEHVVRRLNQDDPSGLSVCNESAIALAFAVLKMRAKCPADVIQMALAGLARTAILLREGSLSEEIKASWDDAIAKMKDKLESLPH